MLNPMTSRLADTLLGRADVSNIHRRVVRVGAIAAWVIAALSVVLALLADNGPLLLDAFGPALAAVFMTGMILLRREHGGVALLVSAVLVLVGHTLSEGRVSDVPPAVALVVMSALGILFIERRVRLAVAATAMGLAAVPQLWTGDLTDAVLLGATMSASFLMTAVVLLALRGTATTVNKRHQLLFDDSPTAVMEEDWSEALDHVRSEFTGPPERIKPFLMAYPAVVRRAVSRARIVRVNQAAIELLEASDESELVGYRDGAKVVDANLEAFVDALVSLYEGEPVFYTETLGLTVRGNPIWIQARCVNVSREKDADAILVGLSDVTLMKNQQQAMADLVKAKDEFIAKVSHELRTPLTGVLGLTSALSSFDSLDENEKKELLEMVATQAAEMSYIVDDLLVASRAEMGAVTVIPEVVAPLSEILNVVTNLGFEGVEICDEIPTVFADPSRLRQIIRNLLTNAQRYGGPNRRIVAGSQGARAWIEVRDDGEGVSPEESQRIFEPYVTAHSGERGSVGLGLSVARQLAELMDGSLTYLRDGDETVFRLELPLAQEAVAAASHK